MSTNNRRVKDKNAGTPTVIGNESVMKGELSGAASVIVLGQFEGDCKLSNLLTVEKTGTWKGSIVAEDAIINGKVEGNVTIANKLELGETGHIEGNVKVGFLAIAQGAVIEGDMQMTGKKDPVEFVEKRK